MTMTMNWFLLAIIGHLANGVAFVIDKMLLRSAFTRSATYAGLVGLLSGLALALIPFASRFPEGSYWLAAFASGITFVFAIWAFFSALARAEASRVVPIVGSLIPILTLVGTFLFLGERLSHKIFLGFALLILATAILSYGGKSRLTRHALWLAILSALLFAISSVSGKATYDATGFLGGFIASRLAAAVTALLLLIVIDPRAGRETLQLLAPKTRKSPSRSTAVLALLGQGSGSIGFFFVQWATAKGSASIVNALQAVQYALLVILAIVLRHKAPQLLGENVTRKIIVLKTTALAIAAVGMYLIV